MKDTTTVGLCCHYNGMIGYLPESITQVRKCKQRPRQHVEKYVLQNHLCTLVKAMQLGQNTRFVWLHVLTAMTPSYR